MVNKNTPSSVMNYDLALDKAQKVKIRNLVSGIYDIQKLRIATGNRVVQSFNIQMGQEPSTSQDELDSATQSLIDTLRTEYKRITDAYVDKQFSELDNGKSKIVKGGAGVKADGDTKISKTDVTTTANGAETQTKIIEFKKNASIDTIIKAMVNNANSGVHEIKSKLDYELVGTYIDLLDTEEKMTKILSKEVEKHPMWDAFFKDVAGCGPLMAGMCISYLDPYAARHVSSFWKYAGYDTVPVMKEDGTVTREGRAKRHVEEQTYTDKEGNTQTKKGITYNPKLKSKLFVLAECMLKAGLRAQKDANGNPLLDSKGNKTYSVANGSKYVECYIDYLSRLHNRADSASLTPLHKQMMAKRYMIKEFLRDLWVIWRTSVGGEVTLPYEVDKLGRNPHKYNQFHTDVAKDNNQNRKIV